MQKVAAEWKEADDNLQRAEAALAQARREVEIIERIRRAAGERLQQHIGSNVPLKVFVVGTDTVIVEYDRTIRRAPIEVVLR
jgi:outer membrane protein TolC